MSTTFTLDGYVLEAMLAFASSNRGMTAHPVLQDVLCEVTPESIRLVSTDTHALGLLHLSPILGYRLDIQCVEPSSLVLPVAQFKPVLKDHKLPVQVTLDGGQVTMTAASGLSLMLPGRPAEEFPRYARVLALESVTPTARTAYDVTLLAKFAAFAKAMGQPPHLDLAFHGPTSPATVRIAGLSGFYGILMPRQIAYEEPIPAWLQPPQAEEPEEPAARVICLHDVDGIAVLSGTDEDGCTWTQFTVDEFAEQQPGICGICGAELRSGWMCGDGGEEVCDDHVQIMEAATAVAAEAPVSPNDVPITMLRATRFAEDFPPGAVVDDDGQVWVPFQDDALPEPVSCARCGATLTDGWRGLDSGEALCAAHVAVTDAVEPVAA